MKDVLALKSKSCQKTFLFNMHIDSIRNRSYNKE